jgi:hypothetical protein
MKIQLEPGKREYTEAEAARALELSPAEFRSLVLIHMVNEKETLANLTIMRFRASDLLLLSMMADGQLTGAEPCISNGQLDLRNKS